MTYASTNHEKYMPDGCGAGGNSPLLAALAVLIIAIVIDADCLSGKEIRRPNIVLIMADDMGYECVGAYGGTSYKTPMLDRLAKENLRFDHCHSQPICTPSRVQLMTGIYNHRNYIKFGLLDPKATTFGHVLKKAGYATCIVGKWQLKGGFDGPHQFGFDEYCLWQLTRRPNRYPNPGLEVNGKEVDYKKGEYGPDIVTDYANGFMERHAKGDKPFFLYYPMMLPHWPFEPTPDSAEWNPKARLKDKTEKSGKGVDNKFFADMVAYTDKMVGKVLAKLDDLGIRKNTLVLFIGDNGTFKGITSMMGDVAVRGGKGMTTDAGTHVPLIASWPGVVEQGVCEDLVDFSDFLPTLAEFGGAPLPNDVNLDGRSFAPQLRGQTGEPRRWIYCWYERNGVRKRASQHVRNQRFKLYATGKLFDVKMDVLEQNPLDFDSLTKDERKAVGEMKAALKIRMAEAAQAKPAVGK